MKKNILYCGVGSADNIGNAFLDYGINGIFKRSLIESNLITSSNMPHWVYNRYYNLFKSISSQKMKVKTNKFDLRTLIDADYYCFGGAFLNIILFKINAGFINYLIKNQSKVLLIGIGGGNNYSEKEISFIKNVLGKLNIICMISRDEETYKNYNDLSQNSYNGIDNAFFLNDYFQPASLKISNFDVFTFDAMKEPKIDSKAKKIIRLQHDLWNAGRIKPVLKLKKNIVRSNDMLSDWADDYLNIYANCDSVYSDRVHACVATLVYGGKAKYFGKSDRSFLFERAGLQDINKELITLDKNKIESEKQNQLKFLTEIIK